MEVNELTLVSRDQIKNQPLMLRPGQLLKGKVLKVNEENMAEIQIGAQKIFAKTSINLINNSDIWFVVQKNGEGIHLQIIDENQFLKGISPQAILQTMGIKVTQEKLKLVKWFQSREIPLNQSLVKSFTLWMTGDTKQDIAVFKTLLDRRLPLTKDVFNAVHSIKNERTITFAINNLQHKLTPYLNNETAQTLDHLLTKFNHLFNDKMLTSLMDGWLKNSVQAKESFSLLQKLGVFSPKSSEEQIIQQLLYTRSDEKNKAILTLLQDIQSRGIQKQTAPFLLTLTKLNHAFSFAWESGTKLQASIKNGEITLPLNANQITSLIKDGLAKLYDHSSTPIKQTSSPLINIYSRLNEQLQVLETLNKSAYSKTQQLLYNIAEETRQQLHTPVMIKGELKQILALFGLTYEQQMNEKQHINIHAIKPLILQLLKDIQQPALTEAAKELLNKITGMQLLSSDTDGLSHFALQLPFPLGPFSKLLSMQWSGKSKKNGEIDPSFCRVLFHLNMETLGETFIKLQIQNRVITMNLSIENTRLLPDTKPFEELIKSKLNEMNYQLTKISFSEITSKMKEEKKDTTNPIQIIGVDMRI
ncbi:hypothetical protein H9655_06845 [Cytobacillus sp. Sa5YUA1]|uniref:Flagellar hook-length control protein FliK n=1 Tax=Cytobacillus stercorigallinarum TaxID=2762240 RepID=A0ABR8QMJ5_9BACI|nr:hypothetical protein [Cytobacillus stercorigallinarum]MBD7936741.1 hypothetical protein [Cytobacillus stercorigallinarum]